MSLKTNLRYSFSESFWGKYKQEDSRYFPFVEKLITNIGKQFGDFVSKTVAAVSSKHFSVPDITEFSTEAKDACTCVDQRCSGNFTGTGALLSIFTYICKEQLSFTDEGG